MLALAFSRGENAASSRLREITLSQRWNLAVPRLLRTGGGGTRGSHTSDIGRRDPPGPFTRILNVIPALAVAAGHSIVPQPQCSGRFPDSRKTSQWIGMDSSRTAVIDRPVSRLLPRRRWA